MSVYLCKSDFVAAAKNKSNFFLKIHVISAVAVVVKQL